MEPSAAGVQGIPSQSLDAPPLAMQVSISTAQPSQSMGWLGAKLPQMGSKYSLAFVLPCGAAPQAVQLMVAVGAWVRLPLGSGAGKVT